MATDTFQAKWLRTMASIVLALSALLAAPYSLAVKPMPVVGAAFVGAVPASIPIGAIVDLTLQIRATEDATDVTVEVLLETGVEFVSGHASWSGALVAYQPVNLPLSIRFTGAGEHTLGARVTNRLQRGVEVSGTSLSIIASGGMASLSTDSHPLMKLRKASGPDELRRVGIAPAPVLSESSVIKESGLFQSAPAVAATVSGTVNYLDPEGHPHPVRRALVQITDGVSGVLLAGGQVATSDTGTYSAGVTANSVIVTVYTQDIDDIRVEVFPKGQPDLRYILASAVTPLGNAQVTINLTSGATVRGTPGHPSNDSLPARAFSAYDAMLTYWFQATALRGSAMDKALTNFPNPASGGGVCDTSCYSNGQMYILHDDAFDWDVLGHEFFHFVTNRVALRVIDSNGGGFHSGGSAIGQNTRQDGTGHVRTRDEGMKLAWSEGLATFMSLSLQQSPAASFGYPSSFFNMADSKYSDTEDAAITLDPETPTASQGFGSENSVLGLLWDLFDSAQDTDNIVTDKLGGVSAKLTWDLINSILSSCNPCNRVDRFWTAAANTLGFTNSLTMTVADLFVLNKIAPEATAPAENASVAGGVAPAFTWTPNGDPSASHKNNKFYLAFSRDNFQNHLILIDVPTLGATSYTPTDAEWQNVQAGGDPGATYKWLVAATRNDAPAIPEGWFWYSNQRSIVPRAFSAKITWSPLGADVDFHLANPVGTDVYYNNLSSSFNGVTWGFLDRDCITSCTEENISINSAPKPGTYRLFAHYFSDHGKGAASVHAEVFAGGNKVLDTSFTLAATGATHDIFTVNIPASGKPEIILNNPPSPGIEFGTLPAKSGDESWNLVPGNEQ